MYLLESLKVYKKQNSFQAKEVIFQLVVEVKERHLTVTNGSIRINSPAYSATSVKADTRGLDKFKDKEKEDLAHYFEELRKSL